MFRGHAKETQNCIPVLREALLLWKCPNSIRKGIRQEQRSLTIRRGYAQSMFLEGSRKRMSRAPPKHWWRE